MEQRNILITRILLLGAGGLGALACGDAGNDLGAKRAALVAECAEAAEVDALPAEAWVCPEARTIECAGGDGTADPGTLYVTDQEEARCADQALSLSNDGPFPVGTHAVAVNDAAGAQLCEAQLTVVDTQAPVLQAKTIQLWPPNHKFHSIAVSDCVSFVDACEGELTGEFIWASSDEPVDDKGDGHHAPDIQFDDCGNISVRAERAGPRNGRVYKLGVRVVDATGQATEGECAVIVDHDQRGVVGADDGEAYRISFAGAAGGPACDGVTDDPSDPPGEPTPPPGDAGPDPVDPPATPDPDPVI